MNIINLTKANFDNEVLKSEVPVLIDFWASWCPPCRALSPVIDELAKELGNSVKICKINTSDEPELTARFNVTTIPTLMVIENGKIKNSSIGVKPKQSILDMLK